MERTTEKSYVTNGLIILYGLCITLCAGYTFKIIPQNFMVSESNNINNTAPVNTEIVTDKVAEKLEEKIESKEFYNRDDYDYPYIIKFDPADGGGTSIMGAMTLSHTNRPAMGDDINSIGKSCKYYFKYTIQGNKILATFTSSDCGGKSDNMILTYDEATGYIVSKTSTGSGGLVFKPMN